MHKKRPKICRVSKAKIYLYHSSKIAKAGPGYGDRSKHPPVQINSNSPCKVPWEPYKKASGPSFQKKRSINFLGGCNVLENMDSNMLAILFLRTAQSNSKWS